MKKIVTIAFIAGLALVSCNKQDPEYREMVSLGAKEKTIECGASYGSSEFYVYADVYVDSKNTEPIIYQADILDNTGWLCFKENSSRTIKKKGSGILPIVYDANDGVKRSARLVLSYHNRTDTLTVKQQGIYSEYIVLSGEYEDVPKEGGKYTADIQTNVLPSKLLVNAGKGIESWEFGKNSIEFTIGPSESRDIREITLAVYTIDGWGDTISDSVTLNQKPGK